MWLRVPSETAPKLSPVAPATWLGVASTPDYVFTPSPRNNWHREKHINDHAARLSQSTDDANLTDSLDLYTASVLWLMAQSPCPPCFIHAVCQYVESMSSDSVSAKSTCHSSWLKWEVIKFCWGCALPRPQEFTHSLDEISVISLSKLTPAVEHCTSLM